ncbi:uncharacterized protein LOC110248288 [Exaiptasia diaphana]|uniref:UPAR/Ly6 domain-containing protein n=1 Tax=Exaiptasia diaphana TaxID=2652724 RepID=A0A913XVF3_EXADI|nr:uncharacterized protein LOC110248288 [Exaiptasia diaphana]
MQFVSRIAILILFVQFCRVKTLKCYVCSSTKDWSSCNHVKREHTCDSGINNCLKAEISVKGPLIDGIEYLKVCSDSCDADKIAFCKTKLKEGLKISCKLNCCKGDLCNAAAVPLVSGFIIMACAMFLAYSLH